MVGRRPLPYRRRKTLYLLSVKVAFRDNSDDLLGLRTKFKNLPLPLEQAIALTLMLPPVIVNEIIYKKNSCQL